MTLDGSPYALTSETARRSRLLITSRGGRWLTAVPLVLGASGAMGAVAGVSAADSRFGDVLALTHLAISVTLPFLGVLAVRDLHQASLAASDRGLAPRLLTAVALACALSVLGSLFAIVATRLGAAGLDGEAVPDLAGPVVRAALVQVIAQLTGTGSGLLLRSPGAAMAATIVVPMAVYLVLGLDRSGTAQSWLTPYGNAQILLAGESGVATTVLHVGVVALLWNVAPTIIGAGRLRRTSKWPLRFPPT